jgi:methyltransferase (TIGR00027 family)
MKPAGERICYDPFARQFVSSAFLYFIKFFVDIGYPEKAGPGVMGFLAARARYIDDYLQSCIKEGLEQLVILGAGYDSRAYRFEQLKSRKVFEVDHPATQEAKLAKLKKILGRLPEHVVYVPIDFTQETLEKRLYESGYDRELKTLFIWEGVTQYLTPEAADSTLAFVARNSGRGSSIIFDYIYTSLLNGTFKRGEVKRMRRYRGFTGEGLTFGIEESTIEDFLGQRGFEQIKNVTNEFLKQAYFTGVNQKRQVASGYAIASATVKPREG